MDEVEEDVLVQTSVLLPASLLAELQEAAAREGRTQSSIIRSALRDRLQRPDEEPLTQKEIEMLRAYLRRLPK